MGDKYVGRRPPANVAYLPDISVTDNVVFDWTADGVEDTIEIDLTDFMDEEFFELNISTIGLAGCHYIGYACDDIAFSDPQTIANTFTSSTNTVWGDATGYIMVGEEHPSARAHGMFQRTGTGASSAIGYHGWDTRWSSGQQVSEYSAIMSTASASPVQKLRMQHKQKTGLTVAPFPAGTRILITLPNKKSKEVVYVGGGAASNKNYIINPDFAINQRGYVNGTTATGTKEYCRDRWALQASGHSAVFANGAVTLAALNGLEHHIEDNGYRGQLTLSWEESGAAPEVVVYSNGEEAGTTPVSSPFTFTASDVMWFRIKNGTFSKLKLEEGVKQTAFETPRPADEILRCMRYFERVDMVWETLGIFRGVSANQAISAFMRSTVSMARKADIVLPTAITDINAIGVSNNLGSVTISNATLGGYMSAGQFQTWALNLTKTSAFVGNSYYGATIWGTSTIVDLDAEL